MGCSLLALDHGSQQQEKPPWLCPMWAHASWEWRPVGHEGSIERKWNPYGASHFLHESDVCLLEGSPGKKDFFLWIHSKGKANGLGKGLSFEEAGDGDGNKRGIPWPCHLPPAATQSLLQPWPSQGHPASPRCPGRGSVPQGCLGRCLFGAMVSSSSSGLVGPLQVSFSVWGPAFLPPVF